MAKPTRAQMVRLMREPDRILAIIGAYMVAAARRAFVDQREPDTGRKWPQRYPNQDGDTLNVAGALEDLARAPRIKPRRYDVRPAGRDTGALLNRTTFEVTNGELRVGSDVPYARRFHTGGESRQRIDTAIKRNLMEFLRSKRRKAKARAKREGVLGPRGGVPGTFRSVEERRLGVVFAAGDYWTTDSPARPFVGLSQRDADDLAEQIQEAASRS